MPSFNEAMQRIREIWSGVGFTQRMLVGGLAVLLMAFCIAMLVWISRPEFGTLYSNLSPEDAGRVLKSLEAQAVPYKIENDGKAILVPNDRVHELRITMAGENILTGQGVGFEIFNDTQIGRTDFVQKLSYRRALEGELARTISEFPGVESARVHLVIPNRSLFLEEQQRASASVLLKLSGTKKLEPKDMDALVNLVSMAVEDLDKGRISIADTNGKVLYKPDEEGMINGLSSTQFEHKAQMERSLERRIEELLTPVVGVGRVMATVNASLDFSQKTIRRELYDPEKTVVRSEMRSESSTQGRASIEGGVPDPNFRGDGPAGTLSDQNSSQENRTTNFEINKEEHNIISNVGAIDRLTVAVIVDGIYTADAEGKMIFAPRSVDEIKQIRQLVANAVGYDSARGDTIEATSMPFDRVDIDSRESTLSILADYGLRFGKPMLNALLAFLFLLLVVRPVIIALIRPKVEGRMIEGLEGLPAPDERLALMDDDDEAVAATAMLEKLEDIKIHALQLSEQHVDQSLGIIKSWLKGGGNQQLPARAA